MWYRTQSAAKYFHLVTAYPQMRSERFPIHSCLRRLPAKGSRNYENASRIKNIHDNHDIIRIIMKSSKQSENIQSKEKLKGRRKQLLKSPNYLIGNVSNNKWLERWLQQVNCFQSHSPQLCVVVQAGSIFNTQCTLLYHFMVEIGIIRMIRSCLDYRFFFLMELIVSSFSIYRVCIDSQKFIVIFVVY